MPTVMDRLPFLGTSGRTQLARRVEACAEAIGKGFDLPSSWLQDAKKLGCGNFGCAYLLANAPADRGVLKFTADNLEAHTVALLRSWGERKPDGIVRYGRIYLLGNCAVLPRARPFVYKHPHTGQQVRWQGPGAPYRPVWAIEREELPDVLPALKARGVKKQELESWLFTVLRWAQDLAVDYIGRRPYFRAFHDESDRARTRDQLFNADGTPSEATVRFGGAELLYAIEWLLERQIAFFDFAKLANLGWREGTGLVIRDIGYSSTELEYEDEDAPSRLGGLGDRGRLGGVLTAPEGARRLRGSFY